MIEFTINPPPNLNHIIRILSMIPGGIEKAGANAVRRTVRGGKKDATQKVKERYVSPVSLMTQTLRLKSSGLTGEMSSSGSRNPLKRFNIRPNIRLNPQPPNGIFAQVVRGQGQNLRSAWSKYSGGIFQRNKGAARLPYHSFNSVSAPQMLGSRPVSTFILDKMEQRLGVNLDHAMNAVLGGFL